MLCPGMAVWEHVLIPAMRSWEVVPMPKFIQLRMRCATAPAASRILPTTGPRDQRLTVADAQDPGQIAHPDSGQTEESAPCRHTDLLDGGAPAARPWAPPDPAASVRFQAVATGDLL
jgi:hypothetical protein